MIDSRQFKRDQDIASVLLAMISATAIWFFHGRNEILLSGDAVAHINIARRVVDSRTPGLLQLGSVWLPLQHMLTIPFVISNKMWQSGIGGSVISAIAYVVGGRGIVRLAGTLTSRSGAWAAVAIYALNPNLIYVQSTALNEPLSIAALIWTTVYFSEFIRNWKLSGRAAGGNLGRLLMAGTLTLVVAMLTRYDGWFLAAMCWALLFLYIGIVLIHRSSRFEFLPKGMIAVCLLLTAAAPAAWMAYNYLVFDNALDFMNGPYSAKAIAMRSTAQGAPPYPGEGNMRVAAMYFQKDAKLNFGDGRGAEIIFALAVLGSLWALLRRETALILLIWSPLLFYSLSIAYGGVPLFLPAWWPFSYYNTRYGLELLPAIAIGFALFVYYLTEITGRRLTRAGIWTPACLLVVFTYTGAWAAVPLCLREVRANGEARVRYEINLANELKKAPAGSTFLVYTGDHSGAIQRAGIRFRNTINEGNYRMWQSALMDPASAADYVVAAQGDPVANAIERPRKADEPAPKRLEAVAVIRNDGQPVTTVYRSLPRR